MSTMADETSGLLRIEGMHCHNANKPINNAVDHRALHEVEVDFNSGLASVMFDVTCQPYHN